jgi:nucleotide-binding universal stress UspA family protein
MIRRLLVPLDGSEVAEAVLPYAIAYATLFDSEVTLLRVVEPVEAAAARPEAPLAAVIAVAMDQPFAAPLVGASVPRAEEEPSEPASERAHAYLVAVAQRLSHAGLQVHTRVAQGQPAVVIAELAASFDLVAMATHGRSGVGRWVYGSVADKVLQSAPVPLLLVRAQPTPPAAIAPITRLLVPLDGSTLAEQALPLATLLAERTGAELVLLQSLAWVQQAFYDPYGYGAALTIDTLIEEGQASAHQYLDAVREPLVERGLKVVTIVRLEAAAEAILTTVEEQQADLIVMSTHGRSGLGRWTLGSVADRVLRGAARPILLVRAGAPPRATGRDEA